MYKIFGFSIYGRAKEIALRIAFIGLVYFGFGGYGMFACLAPQFGKSAQARVVGHSVVSGPFGQEINGKAHQHYILSVEFENKNNLRNSDIEVKSGVVYQNTLDGAMVGIHYFSFFPSVAAMDGASSDVGPFVLFAVFTFVACFGSTGNLREQEQENG